MVLKFKCEYCNFSSKYQYELKIHPPQCPSKINQLQYTLDELKQLYAFYADINARENVKEAESYYTQTIEKYSEIKNYIKLQERN
jgi:hypothetical protein